MRQTHSAAMSAAEKRPTAAVSMAAVSMYVRYRGMK